MNTITSKEFHATFALSKTKMFNVSYYTLGNNKTPYFSTSADVFNRPKTDWSECGQCQERVLNEHAEAMKFYRKWDAAHLKELSDDRYNEMISDMERLFQKYPYLLEQQNENGQLKEIRFGKVKDFSMNVYRK